MLVSASRRNELSWRFVAGVIRAYVREVRDGEDAIANTRAACAPQISRLKPQGNTLLNR